MLPLTSAMTPADIEIPYGRGRFGVYALHQIKGEKIMNLKGRDFLTLKDYTKEEILYLLDVAAAFKDKKKRGIPTLFRWTRTLWSAHIGCLIFI